MFFQNVKQELSDKQVIDYHIGDKSYSAICDYMKSCQYTCRPDVKISEKDVTLDTYGHVTGLGACNLDNRYYEHACICSFFNRGYAACIESAADCAIGWYTIATNSGGANALDADKVALSLSLIHI